MPGRPEVARWIRGIDDQQAQTTIAWRAELELFSGNPTPEKALQAIFIKHPIRPHELLTVNTGYLLEFLKQIPKLKERLPNLMTTKGVVRLSRGQIVCRTLQHLIDDPGILYSDSTLILPAKFGGLNNSGMLDAESIPKTRKEDDVEPPSLDIADHPGYEQREDPEPRLRVLIRRNKSDRWAADAVPGGVALPTNLQLESSYDRSSNLINALTSGGLRLRLVQPIKFDDEGDPNELLVLLSPVSSKGKPEDQSLSDHVGAVEEWAIRIADALGLAEDDPVRIALLFAAKWHDEGKKAAIWQTYANGPMPDGTLKGKSRKYRDPKSLSHTRHELESLLRIAYAAKCDIADCVLPADPIARDLALHLIAVHHGFGRPHFPEAFYRGFTTDEYEAIHTEFIRRFAKLQRKYCWWHLAWLENLLRCADALASADEEVTEIDELEGGQA